MECIQCGAPLRPGAHFCNQCGAHQPTDDAPAHGEVENAAVPPADGEAGGDPGTSGGRAKRPPRVPRAGTDEAAHSRETAAPIATSILEQDAESASQAGASLNGSAGSPATDMEPDAEVATAQTDEAPPASGDSDAEDAAPVDEMAVQPEQRASPEAEVETEAAAEIMAPEHGAEPEVTMEAQPDDADWAEAETAEYNTILATGKTLRADEGSPVGGVPGMPALDELVRTGNGVAGESEGQAGASWRDGMPWPLPESIIVGGRYRVEALISTAQEAAGAENVYRVHDLQGYERCWSCGAEHGASAASDAFCQECGADMLSRDFLMSERSLTDAEAATEERLEAETTKDGDATEVDVRIFVQGQRAYRVTPLVTESPLFPRGPQLSAAAATDTGASRAGEVNEDSFGLFALSLARESYVEPFALAVVADGLGGHANGQEASRLVVQRLADHVLRAAALPFAGEPRAAAHGGFESVAVPALRAGIEEANAALCQMNEESGADMGSTLVALLLFGATAYIANVGDSRAYVLDEDGLRRISTDHSLVEQLIAAGQIGPEERYTHPQRNQILRSIGDEPNVPVDLFQQQLRPGMRFLLCSDGLWEMVRDDECERILREAQSPQQACDLLIQAANANGGEDNITAVVVEVSA